MRIRKQPKLNYWTEKDRNNCRGRFSNKNNEQVIDQGQVCITHRQIKCCACMQSISHIKS